MVSIISVYLFYLLFHCFNLTGTGRVGDHDGGGREGARLLLRQAEGHRTALPGERRNASPVPYPIEPPIQPTSGASRCSPSI